MSGVTSTSINYVTSPMGLSSSKSASFLVAVSNAGIFLKGQVVSLTNSLVRNSYNTVVNSNYIESTSHAVQNEALTGRSYSRFLDICYTPYVSRISTYETSSAPIKQAFYNACLTAAAKFGRAILCPAKPRLLNAASTSSFCHAPCGFSLLGGGIWHLRWVENVLQKLIVRTASTNFKNTIGKGFI